jgi:hypothetical protein
VVVEIIDQLYAGEDAESTRFDLLDREIPRILQGRLEKIGFEAPHYFYSFEDRPFGTTEIKHGFFEISSIE